MKNAPSNFPGSIWSSDDGRVKFTVDENRSEFGTINVDGEAVEVFYSISPTSGIEIYPSETYITAVQTGSGLSHDERIELWGGNFYSDSEFKVYARETTYFTEGESLVVRGVS